MSDKEKAAEERESLTGKQEAGYGATGDGGESGDAGGAAEGETPTASTAEKGRFATKSSSRFW